MRVGDGGALGEGQTRDERGFILAVVLWIAGLLAVLAATFSLSVRSHVRVAANIGQSAAAEALADAGVALAVMDLVRFGSDPGGTPRFAPGKGATACAMRGGGSLSIAVSDESARIDLNSAGTPILQALLAGLGEPPERALALAEAVLDFRDEDDIRRPNGAERAEYQAAGLAWGPKNAGFEALEELEQVFGMRPALIEKMRPYIGIRSGLAGVDLILASPALIALLRKGVEASGALFGNFSDLDPDNPLPSIFNTPAPRRFFQVRAEAIRPGGARFMREAVVEISKGGRPAYTLRDWKRAASDRSDAVAIQNAPPC